VAFLLPLRRVEQFLGGLKLLLLLNQVRCQSLKPAVNQFDTAAGAQGQCGFGRSYSDFETLGRLGLAGVALAGEQQATGRPAAEAARLFLVIRFRERFRVSRRC
jgi:hypothetical protein